MENNWTIEQTKTLFSLAREAKEKERGLVWAFSAMSDKTGRSVNSVRNYYYSQLKMFELVPSLAKDLGIELVDSSRERFELFEADEIDELLENVLSGKARGVSVRQVIADMSGGDGKKALRLQNKYRSMILHHREKVNEVMRRIGASGKDYYNPYLKETVAAGSETDNYKKLNDYIASLDEAEVGEFLQIMKKFFA
ncbi:MAG: hypothetical protein HFE35_05225 [Clostridia bacterium]|jgi:hypothetical protein|uniref:hypothetical protein n=1 Tax=Pumilibacter muris TaxID=2941510 RepID=UPI00203CC74E|nr:hypothetical protein [Pumilibacter muris]MCI8596198.1 hypothetical protein [Clostridia bacterium]